MNPRTLTGGATERRSRLARVRDALFGDELGLALFLGGLCVTWLTWRVGFFITDTYAVANTLVNVAGGHLTVERIEYSLTLGSQPGLHVVDGRLYGRNYGQVFLSLPVYYGLELAGRVVDLRSLLPGVLSLLVLAFVRQVGVVTDRRRVALAVGSALALILFLPTPLVASPFDDGVAGIVALQAVSTAAVAATAVLLYRTLGRQYDRRVAIAAGAGVVLATPLWFWASIPKRHVLTALGVTALLFAFHGSREVDSSLGLRALGYVVAGFVAWIHVFEGVALLLAYGTADLATARSTGLREVVVVVLALSLALGPFVATNAAVSGNPLEPPRLTPGFEPDRDQGVELGPGGAVVRTDESAGDSGGEGASGGNDDPADGSEGEASGGGTADSPEISESIGRAVRQGQPYVKQTVAAVDTAPTRLYHTYVRSGNIESVGYGANQREPIDLTLLESAPSFGVLVAGVVLGLSRLRRRVLRSLPRDVSGLSPDVSRVPALFLSIDRRARTARPDAQTAGLALVIVACFGTIYLSRLPTFSQITVRYLLPTVPALGYLAVRVTPVRRAVREQTRALVVGYVLAVAVGFVLVVVGFPLIDPAIGEAMQLHALVNLGTAAVAGVLVTGSALGAGVDDRVVAVGLALPAAGTTVLVAFMHLAYFQYGVYAVPLVRVAESLTLLS